MNQASSRETCQQNHVSSFVIVARTSSALIMLSLMTISLSLSGCARDGGSPFRSNPLESSRLSKMSLPFSKTPMAGTNPVLLESPGADPQAPDRFKAKFTTSKGSFVAEINREWSPNGADHFYHMVTKGYFNDIVIFRGVKNFMFQFGIHPDPAVNKVWAENNIKDDPAKGISNLPGMLCFAKTGMPNSRSVQMFVNLGNNAQLDSDGFTPFGKIIEGLDVVQAINTEYGENPPGEDIQGNFKKKGNDFILKRFPRLDIIRSVELVN